MFFITLLFFLFFKWSFETTQAFSALTQSTGSMPLDAYWKFYNLGGQQLSTPTAPTYCQLSSSSYYVLGSTNIFDKDHIAKITYDFPNVQPFYAFSFSMWFIKIGLWNYARIIMQFDAPYSTCIQQVENRTYPLDVNQTAICDSGGNDYIDTVTHSSLSNTCNFGSSGFQLSIYLEAVNTQPCAFAIRALYVTLVLCDTSCLTCTAATATDCTSCIDGKYLMKSGASTTGSCQACNSPCVTCVGTGSYCTSCNSGFYASGGACSFCNIPCMTCSNTANNCTSCSAGYFLASVGTCTVCDSTCSTCVGNQYNCTSCPSPKILAIAAGICSCPNGYWVYNDNCYQYQCPANTYQLMNTNICEEACGTLYLFNNTQCVTSCPSTAPLICNGTCVSSCPANTFLNSTSCLSQCPNGTIASGVICISGCASGLYFFNNSCYASCPSNTYIYLTTFNCVSSCNSTQYIYNSNQCVDSCPTGANLTYNGLCYSSCPTIAPYFNSNRTSCVKQCVINQYLYQSTCYLTCPSVATLIYNGSCYSTCPSIAPLTSSNGTYCISQCVINEYLYQTTCYLTCPSVATLIYNGSCYSTCPSTAPLTSSNGTYCISQCAINEYLYQSKCYIQCPSLASFTYNSSCYSTCPSNAPYYTFAGTSCLSQCATNQYLYQFTCYTNCPNGTFSYLQSCLTNCVDPLLVDGTQCVSNCSSGRYIDGKTCVLSCSNLLNYDNNTCISSCPNNSFLLNETTCYSQCPDPYLGFNGACLIQCPTNYTQIGTTCILGCNSNTFYLNGSCISLCPDGYYANTTTQTCTQCNPTCQTCSGITEYQCLSCNSSAFYNKDLTTCYQDCPLYYYANKQTKECLRCSSHCVQCLDNNTCIICTNNSKLVGSYCKGNKEVEFKLTSINNPYSFKLNTNFNWSYFYQNFESFLKSLILDDFKNNSDYTYIQNYETTSDSTDISLLFQYNKAFQNEKNLTLWLSGEDSTSSSTYYYYVEQNISVTLKGVSIICKDFEYFSESIKKNFYSKFYFLSKLHRNVRKKHIW